MDVQVDMFSLGLTLLELARGEPLPKDGAAYQAIRKGKAPMPQRFSPSSLLIRSIKVIALCPANAPFSAAFRNNCG